MHLNFIRQSILLQSRVTNFSLSQVVEPVLSKFKALIGQENFVRNYHEAQNKNTFINCFDAFIGGLIGEHYVNERESFA